MLISERECRGCLVICSGSGKVIKVKTHVSNILAKLQVEDRTQAALLAVKNGWVDDRGEKG